MWLFGKKSNKPVISPDLPPELRPFYGQQKAKSTLIGPLLAILLVVIVIAAVLLGFWLHGRNASVQTAKSSTQSSNQATKGSQTTKATPAPKIQTNPVVSAQPAQPTTPAATIPNTGPGMNTFLIAGVCGLIGAVYYHVRQLRKLS